MRYRFKTKPYRHQIVALKRLLRQRHLGLLWEPGTGKTKAIIDAACALHLSGGLQRVLVVCPLSVVGVWEEEFEKHAPISYTLNILSRTDTPDDWTTWDNHFSIMIANYDLVWRRPQIVERFQPQMVVADESHRIKKPSARRSRYMRRFKDVPYRAILTGTPTPKSFIDLYSQWVFLNAKQFGTNFSAFKRRYVIFGGYLNKQVKGYTNVPELKAKIKEDAYVRRKDQCLDLPDQTFQRVPVVLEPEAMQAYMKMEYELFLELKNGEVSDAKNIAVKVMRLQQITGGWITSDEGNLHMISQAKLRACQERLEDLWDDDERVVCFARFRAEVQAVADFGIRSRIPTYVLSGAVRREERDAARRRFQTEVGPSLFVAQIQTGGLGITLHSSAEVIFYSVTYALDDYIQACDRVHRIGQTRNVRYQHLVVPSSVDADIYANLQGKKNMMAEIMGDPQKFAKHLQGRIEKRV